MPRPQLPPRKTVPQPQARISPTPRPAVVPSNAPKSRLPVTPKVASPSRESGRSPVVKVKPKKSKPVVFKSFQDLAQHVEVKEEKKAEVKQAFKQRTKDRSRVEEVVKHNPHRVQARITWQGLTYLAFIDEDGNKVIRDLSGGGKPWDISMFISSADSPAEFRRLLAQAVLLLR